MNISSTHRNTSLTSTRAPKLKKSLAKESPIDLVDIGNGLRGAVPLYGALANGTAHILLSFSSSQKASNIAGVGALANLAGTTALTAGLLLGSSMTSYIGAGLLVGSGIAHAAAGSEKF